ncbi:MAG: geranylgeranylglyceryl/heptaprenylglyceryl phosphate synthase [Bacteroidota bacterium]
MKIFKSIIDNLATGKKLFSVLIDPDKSCTSNLQEACKASSRAKVDYFFIGGSLITNDTITSCIKVLRDNSDIPIVIFPGNTMQVHKDADAILFLSLISGRNPEMLIGKHVIAAPYIKQYGLEVIPTGYMLIESGRPTTALYMSNTIPIPHDKDDIAVCTALAGEMLGLKMIYMDAGSGAMNHIGLSMIGKVKKNISIPLIIGGGIRTAQQAKDIYSAGADMIVIGNAVEKNTSLIGEIAESAIRFS